MSDDAPTPAPTRAPDHQAVGRVVVIGAGPAGLTAAYELGKAGVLSTVLEADDAVGGISRTVVRDGYRFDIGGHRFFTKVGRVEDLWHEILADDEFLLRPRSSRIYYDGKFIDYPLRLTNALRSLGPIEALRCGVSFLWVRVRPPKDRSTLEGYIAADYGWRLYRHFFKTYNEKVWAVPASEISADWGAQRIKGMSLWSAVWEPLRARLAGTRRDRSKQVTSLIEQFQYPRYGPGMMWERCRDLVEAAGTKVIMETPVTRIRHGGGRATAVVAESDGV
ncbi:MAG TPA: NAD(P)-binding protein, partial [Acidimicrobiales bacterium]|nr:NAD(P)-binding protein [Acidimicrobiales bacterium]